MSPQEYPTPAPKSGRTGCLVALGVVGAVIVGLVLLNNGEDDTPASSSSSSPSSSPSFSLSQSQSPSPSVSSPYDDPYDSTTDPAAAPSSEAPDPFDKGTCLNGTLPDSTTAQSVSGVEEVSCSASDAHYRVIQTIPLTSDLSRCNSNSRTQYAFSHRYTLNGSTINEYVYCLVGIGSYAR
ncbi:hypothetical protein U9R90_18325 [Streptomyces sp. E11-3]|uniref:LppU/SCO3897 family protein n=1 Tax=Streptomyces sp. E11-3 TaxID=3110112 RepID=UPI00397FCE08